MAIACVLFTSTKIASAGVIYQVSVDTSALNGTTGNIDFQFNPGDASSQAALATIGSFIGGTVNGLASVIGGVSGNLPSTVTIGNSGAFNDYFQPFTFGNSFSFVLQFSGPAITAPDGVATTGSAFGLSLFNAAGDTPLLTSDSDGFIATANVNLDGTIMSTTYPTVSGSAPIATLTPLGTPEPATMALLGAPLLLIGGVILRRRRS